MLLSLDHVTLRSSDFDRCERFYCGLLGMRVGPRPAFAVPGRWFYVGDKAVLHVLPAQSGGDTSARCTIDHFAIRATGLTEYQQRLASFDQAYDLKRQPGSGDWQMFMADPDGAIVELDFEAHELFRV